MRCSRDEHAELELKIVSRSEKVSGDEARYGTALVKRRDCSVEVGEVSPKCFTKGSSGRSLPVYRMCAQEFHCTPVR